MTNLSCHFGYRSVRIATYLKIRDLIRNEPLISPMTAHCHTHSCACANMSDSMELINASAKSKGSPSSSGREAFSLGNTDAFRYENVPAEFSMTDTT